MHKEPNGHIQHLFQDARQYEAAEDYYNAVKLYKRIVKDASDWAAPFLRLGHIYKYRQEWKPALYYNKRAIALQVDNRQAWWDVGIAATALKKRKLARRVWSKFGYTKRAERWQPASVQLSYSGQLEVMWVQRVGPCLGHIRSIPQPASGRRYGDLVLVDNILCGHHNSGAYRLPIYKELGLLKGSHYRSFSCLLIDPAERDIQLLQKLCYDRKMGFEVWGNAAEALSFRPRGGQPEYYAFNLKDERELLVSIAALHEEDALQALSDWEVISLKAFAEFRAHQVC